jgi:hypothetical protein
MPQLAMDGSTGPAQAKGGWRDYELPRWMKRYFGLGLQITDRFKAAVVGSGSTSNLRLEPSSYLAE